MRNYKLMTGLFCCLFVMGGVFFASAGVQPWDERSDEEAAQQEMGSVMSGKVISVDTFSENISVLADSNEGDGRTYNFLVKTDTTFTGASSLADISRGDRVTVNYYVYEGRQMADSILLNQRAINNTPLEGDGLLKVLSD